MLVREQAISNLPANKCEIPRLWSLEKNVSGPRQNPLAKRLGNIENEMDRTIKESFSTWSDLKAERIVSGPTLNMYNATFWNEGGGGGVT